MARESTIGSTFHLETLPAGTAGTITGATAASKAEVTTTTTVAVGDFVRIGGTGWPSLDRKTSHRVSAVGTGKIVLDTDTSKETGTAPTAGSIVKVVDQEVCFAEFGVDSPAPNDVDVTTMCDLERRNVAGLSNPGSATFGGPLDLTDSGIQALIHAQADGLARSMRWKTRNGQTGLLYGVVSSFTGGPQGVEQAVTFSGTFTVQDRAIYLPPLVAGTAP